MNTGIIADRYAKALLLFAEENKDSDTVYREMIALRDCFAEQPLFRKAVENPVETADNKRDLILTAAAVSSKSLPLFVGLLTENNRITLLRSIVLQFIQRYRQGRNIKEVKLITAAPVSEEVKDKFRKLVSDTSGSATVEFHETCDKDIIGGFILQFDSCRMDSSVRSRLKRIREALRE
jgi:F-type H+-transporting ATPase subunit delta